MPHRTRSHVLEDHSRNHLREMFVKEGWTVEDLDKDYGEDMLVRIFEGGATTPFSFLVQAKATDNFHKYPTKRPDSFQFRVESGHVRHWMLFAEPVFLTVFDAGSSKTYWVCVQDALLKSKFKDAASKIKKTVPIVIPLRNVLDQDGVTRIKGITKLRFGRLDRHNEAVKLLIKILKGKGVHVTTFDPDEGYVAVKSDDGGEEGFVFGDLAELITRLQGKLNLTASELLHRAIKLAFEDLQSGGSDAETITQDMLEDEANRQRAAASRKHHITKYRPIGR